MFNLNQVETYFTQLLIPESKHVVWQLGHAMYNYRSVGSSTIWLPSSDVDVDTNSGFVALLYDFLLWADTTVSDCL
jgi:hypothetical protein